MHSFIFFNLPLRKRDLFLEELSFKFPLGLLFLKFNHYRTICWAFVLCLLYFLLIVLFKGLNFFPLLFFFEFQGYFVLFKLTFAFLKSSADFSIISIQVLISCCEFTVLLICKKELLILQGWLLVIVEHILGHFFL